MSKLAKEIHGVKIIRRHSVGCIISMILCLLMAATVVCFFLPMTPLFVVNLNDSVLQIKGIDIPFYMFKVGVTEDPATTVNTYAPFQAQLDALGEAGVSNMLFGYLQKFFVYVEGALILLTVVLAIVQLVFAFEYLIRGRVSKYKSPVKIARWMILLNLLTVGLPIGLIFGLSFILKGTDAEIVQASNLSKIEIIFTNFQNADLLMPTIMCFIPFVASIVITIFLNITYKAAFKNKVFVGDIGEFMHGEILEDNTKVVAERKSNAYDDKAECIKEEKIQEVKTVMQETPKVTATPASAEEEKTEKKIVKKSEPSLEEHQMLPKNLESLGGHAFAENTNLIVANIPQGIDRIGLGAFANCLNLKMVAIPKSVKKISPNAFFNCSSLERISYGGTREDWRHIARGSNWLARAKTTTVVCLDGPIIVNPLH